MGLTQSKYNKCLFYGKDLLVACYCNDDVIVAKDEAVVDQFLALTNHGFEFTKEEGLFEYLGIKMTRNDSTSTFTLTQMGLIEKIAMVTGLTASNGNRVPALKLPSARTQMGSR
jgi:hypothetical protein